MVSEPTNPVLAELLKLASNYAAERAQPESRIYADLDINGGDFIEFIETVERLYNVDLDWVSPRDHGKAAHDATIRALADDVLRQRRECP